VPMTSDDHILALRSNDDDGLIDGIAMAAQAEGIGVTLLYEPAVLPGLLAQIPMTVRLQLLAERFAAERGQNPDQVIVGAWNDKDLWAIGYPKG